MPQNVLITGAAGTIAFEVLKQLYGNADYALTLFARNTASARKKLAPYRKGAELRFGDICSGRDVEELCKAKRFDFVIHLAALIPPAADEDRAKTERVNVEACRSLLQALSQYSPGAFFLYSSSVTVYGDRLAMPEIRVGDRLQANEGDFYALSKIAAEEVIQKSALDWTIFRLAAIMGKHKMSKLMFHVPLDTPMEICTVRDAARAFVLGLRQREALSRRIFNLGGGEACRLTYRELLAEHFKLFGLGALDFPDKSFAEKNFHCGFYADGDQLEALLQFRSDELKAYFQSVKAQVNPVIRRLTQIMSPLIKRYLLSLSEPYKAHKNNLEAEKRRFF